MKYSSVKVNEQGYALATVVTISVGILLIAAITMQYIASLSSSARLLSQSLTSEAASAGVTRSSTKLLLNGINLHPWYVGKTNNPNSPATYDYDTFTQSKGIDSGVDLYGTDTAFHISAAINSKVGAINYSSHAKTYTPIAPVNIYMEPQLSLGYLHTCAITRGSVYCWGRNNYGQLGDGTKTDRNKPVAVAAGVGEMLHGKHIYSLAAGGSHSCAIADKKVYCWGRNNYGQLGDGTKTDRNKPVAVAAGVGEMLHGKDVYHIVTGEDYSCAIADKKVYCWGRNNYGQLGDGTKTDRNKPVAVAADKVTSSLYKKVVSTVAAGSTHSCAIAEKRVHCWGRNNYGQLGDGTKTDQTLPVRVNTSRKSDLIGKEPTHVSLGLYHSCSLAEGDVFCWGSNRLGQVGNGHKSLHQLYPVKALKDSLGGSSSKLVTHIQSARNHSCLTAEGSLYCWGENINNQLGTGSSSTSIEKPMRVQASQLGNIAHRQIEELSVGPQHMCVFMTDNSLYCRGNGEYGKLGKTTARNQEFLPTEPVANGLAIVKTNGKITDRISSRCIIESGDISCFNKDIRTMSTGLTPGGSWTHPSESSLLTLRVTKHPQDRIPPTLDSKSSQAISSNDNRGGGYDPRAHALNCVLAEGKLHCWGIADQWIPAKRRILPAYYASRTPSIDAVNSYKVFGEKPDDPLYGKYISSFSASDRHVCAIAEGALYCWGDNKYGQVGVNSSDNSYGYDGRPVTTPTRIGSSSDNALYGKTVTQVYTAKDSTCAIADGKAYCWGSNKIAKLGYGNPAETNSYYQIKVKPREVGSDSPVNPLKNKTVTQVITTEDGGGMSCAIADGEVYCWGKLRLAAGGDTNTPTRIADREDRSMQGETIVQLFYTNNTSMCAVSLTNKIFCWGAVDVPGALDDNYNVKTQNLGSENLVVNGPINVPFTATMDAISGFSTRTYHRDRLENMCILFGVKYSCNHGMGDAAAYQIAGERIEKNSLNKKLKTTYLPLPGAAIGDGRTIRY